jgi:2'-5' RNA ligase
MSHRKYFLAIIIPQPLLDEIEKIKLELYNKHGLKGALRSKAHITLHRPFEWKEEKEAFLIEALQQFKFSNPCSIELQNFNCFEPRVIYVDVLTNIVLNELHNELKYFAQKNLKLLNEVNDMRGFHPHITIAFRDLKKPLFYELWQTFEQKKFNGNFKLTEFALLRLEEKWETKEVFKLN